VLTRALQKALPDPPAMPSQRYFSARKDEGLLPFNHSRETSTNAMNGPTNQRISRASYHIALALIFVIAAFARLRLPPWPLADPDTPGYLEPAISKLAEGVFTHTDGRNFLYPGILLIVLGATHTFAAISFVQHLLGLATGGLMLCCWRKTKSFLHHVSPRVHDFLGLLLVAIYLLARQSIQFEHELRPEAIAPFFAILNILLTLVFIDKRYRTGPSWPGAIYGVLILVNSVILTALKPVFVVSVLFSIVPVLNSVFDRRETWPRRGFVVFAGLVAAATMMLTERALARSDVVAKMFLPATLFTIHANLIAEQMDEDIARNDCGPRGCTWLREVSTSLREELRKSRELSKIYPSLGFDPDYLMYDDSLRLWRTRFFDGSYDQQFEFYTAYYLRTARIHPERMIAKVVRQLSLFYLGAKHFFVTSPRANIGSLYTQTVASLQLLTATAHSYRPFVFYFGECERLSSSRETISQSLLIRGLGALLSVLYPPVFFLTLGVAVFIRGPSRQIYRRFAVVALFVFSYNFGNCLVTAIVHSLSNTRYVTTQYSFGLLAECIGLLFLFDIAMETRGRMFQRLPLSLRAEPRNL
jgi:hypothetical protein